MIKNVSMMNPAVVDLLFFFEINNSHSRISRRPDSGSYAPKMLDTKSRNHGRLNSPHVGLPG